MSTLRKYNSRADMCLNCSLSGKSVKLIFSLKRLNSSNLDKKMSAEGSCFFIQKDIISTQIV